MSSANVHVVLVLILRETVLQSWRGKVNGTRRIEVEEGSGGVSVVEGEVRLPKQQSNLQTSKWSIVRLYSLSMWHVSLFRKREKYLTLQELHQLPSHLSLLHAES
jgi:hypothetical protein